MLDSALKLNASNSETTPPKEASEIDLETPNFDNDDSHIIRSSQNSTPSLNKRRPSREFQSLTLETPSRSTENNSDISNQDEKLGKILQMADDATPLSEEPKKTGQTQAIDGLNAITAAEVDDNAVDTIIATEEPPAGLLEGIDLSFNGRFAERSPEDMFADIEEDEEQTSYLSMDETNYGPAVDYEDVLLKRLHQSLSGVLPPPPSIAAPKMTIDEMLHLYKANVDAMVVRSEGGVGGEVGQRHLPWPEAMQSYSHGIHYNRSTKSERIETLCLKFADRFIGAEMSSSFVTAGGSSPSSAKKRATRSKMIIQSPGSRLSHLAKRRAVFSSSSLRSKAIAQQNRQIILSKRPLVKGRPRVKTPRPKTPGRKTPNSKKKPREMILVRQLPVSSVEPSRRALFQSPETSSQWSQALPKIREDIALRAAKSKRALFSPPGAAAAKRKRETDDEAAEIAAKLPKSQSFSASTSARIMQRTLSDSAVLCRRPLTETQKQKLLWAVATALKNKHVTSSHPDYKTHAQNLTRVVKRIFLQFEGENSAASTSERLKKIANTYVFQVLRGASVEDVVHLETIRLENIRNNRKLEGYIGPEEYEARLKRQRSAKSEDSAFSQFSQFSQASSQVSSTYFGSQELLVVNDSSNQENQVCEPRPPSSKKSSNFSGKDQKNVGAAPPVSSGNSSSGGKESSAYKVKRQISFDL